MTRHIAYFIENILRPFIKDLDGLLGKCEHLKINSEDMERYIDKFLDYYFAEATWLQRAAV